MNHLVTISQTLMVIFHALVNKIDLTFKYLNEIGLIFNPLLASKVI
tara:strand:- start:481 stop:618 length:138 start_codon:yes stop_codon:yes gene_type:complete